MKNVIIAWGLFLLLCAGFARAEVAVTVEPLGVTLKDVLIQTQPGIFYTMQGKTLTSLSAPVVSCGAFSIDGGVVLELNSNMGSPFLALDRKIIGGGIVSLQIGGGWFAPTHSWFYGLGLIGKFK
jgi:hypothetical protein